MANMKEVQWKSTKLLREVKCVTCEEKLRELNLLSLQKGGLIWDRIASPLLRGDLKTRPIQSLLKGMWWKDKRQCTQTTAVEIQMGYKEKIGHCGSSEAEEQVPKDVISLCLEILSSLKATF